MLVDSFSTLSRPRSSLVMRSTLRRAVRHSEREGKGKLGGRGRASLEGRGGQVEREGEVKLGGRERASWEGGGGQVGREREGKLRGRKIRGGEKEIGTKSLGHCSYAARIPHSTCKQMNSILANMAKGHIVC